MANVTGLQLVGGAYNCGHYSPGWGKVLLDTGTSLFVGEKDANGFDSLLDFAEAKGHDTADYRKRLARWVATGSWV